MDKFLMTDVNFFSIVICLIILLDVNNKFEKKFRQNNIFILLLVFTILLCIVDSTRWLLNGGTDRETIIFSYLFTSLLYVLEPLSIGLWMAYVLVQIDYSLKGHKKLVVAMVVPYILFVVFISLNILHKGLFYIDEKGFYQRGAYYLLLPAICYYYIACVFYIILKNRKKTDKKTYLALLVFPVPPAIAGFFQALFPGVATLCAGITLALLIIYINIQNKRIYTDYLTGVFNRREADGFVQHKISEGWEAFSAIMFDIDKFKEINDRLGHQVGDDALENVVRIIKNALRSNDFIARYGGDEFLAVLNISDKKQLEKTVARIQLEVEAFNKNSHKPYMLSLSMGYDIYDRIMGLTEDQFLKRIDNLMYREKSKKKNLNVIKEK